MPRKSKLCTHQSTPRFGVGSTDQRISFQAFQPGSSRSDAIPWPDWLIKRTRQRAKSRLSVQAQQLCEILPKGGDGDIGTDWMNQALQNLAPRLVETEALSVECFVLEAVRSVRFGSMARLTRSIAPSSYRQGRLTNWIRKPW